MSNTRTAKSSWSGALAVFVRWWAPLLAYMGLIFWMSGQTRFDVLRRSPDYVLHFIGYFGMGLLAVRAFSRGLKEPRTKFWGYIGLLFAFGYALTDEWHQSYVPGRVASGRDLMADGMGIMAAWIFLLVFWRRLRRTDARSTAVSVE